jgi:two-component system response regulator
MGQFSAASGRDILFHNCGLQGRQDMESRVILLVEDNPRDEALTLRALKKNNVMNDIVVAHDGVEALDYLLGTGTHAGRDTSIMPHLVLLDLKMPKVDGLQVLQGIRANDRTRRLPVVIFTSSREEEDLAKSYDLGANSYVRKPVDFGQFLEATRQLGIYWLIHNEVPPAV